MYVPVHLMHACPYAVSMHPCMSIIVMYAYIMDMHESRCIHTYTIIALHKYYFVLTRVQPPVVGVPVPAIGKDKCLHAPLG